MLKTNNDIKQEAKKLGVKLWQVAERLGVNDGNLSRKLRHELPTNEKRKIFTIIKELSKVGVN